MIEMNDVARFPTVKFGIGQPVSRKEDPRLLRGGGRFTDDLLLPDMAIGYVLRSAHGHGAIGRLDAEAARQVPGVLAVYTAEDMDRAGYGPLPCALPLKSHDGTPLIVPERPLLAKDRVRYMGEPIAFIVAESLNAAKDGAEAVELEIEALPAAVGLEAAIAPGAPRLFEEMPGNVAVDWHFGDAEAVARALAGAAHVTRLRLVNNRVVAASMEPRGAVAEYESGSEHFTLHLGCQGVFGMRGSVAALMTIEPERLRVRAYDIGGSFGMKGGAYPEYVLVLHAARALGRPVKWIDQRTDAFVSDLHGRDAVIEAQLGLDSEGNFLALRVDGLGALGGYTAGFAAWIPTVNLVKNMIGLYRTPAIAAAVKCVVTNCTPTSAYRGAGRPEANYYMERLVDLAARETGHDPIALRRRNLIPPVDMPFEAASGQTYDSGEFAAVLDAALKAADRDGFAARRADSESRGMKRGMGIASYLEVTAPPMKEMGGLRFEEDGGVTIVTGTLDYGQGHQSAFAQVLVSMLGVPFESIRLSQGDSNALLAGGGTGGSRSITASGEAIFEASEKVIEQGRALAGHFLEAAEADIEFAEGAFRVAGTDRAIPILELAARVREAEALPEGLPESLDAEIVTGGPPSAFPNGCHIAEVEIDPETGAVEIVRYSAVDDFGTIVNPMLVEGQVHGGVVQGIGQALMEHTVYDENGALLAGSFMDYALPRAANAPFFDISWHPVPATTNPLGTKGCGEAGTTGALPAIMNAVVDALADYGITHIDMPATPERIWQAIRDAQS